jgi:REP element-mobilizing transposase RayT
LYRIGGVSNHVHIVTHVHPTIAPANLIKDIKLASSSFIKSNGIFPEFEAWQEGYGAFTYSINEKDRLIEYVKKQEEHHAKRTYREELIELLHEHHIDFDDNYLN